MQAEYQTQSVFKLILVNLSYAQETAVMQQNRPRCIAFFSSDPWQSHRRFRFRKIIATTSRHAVVTGRDLDEVPFFMLPNRGCFFAYESCAIEARIKATVGYHLLAA